MSKQEFYASQWILNQVYDNETKSLRIAGNGGGSSSSALSSVGYTKKDEEGNILEFYSDKTLSTVIEKNEDKLYTDVETGAIHYAPYFDGFDDIEKYFIMRHDWVKKLLDGEGSFSAEISDLAGAVEYEPYMPTSGSVTIDSLNAAGDAVIQITKNYDTTYGNIVAYMNSHITATTTGVELVNMLRGYIDVAYGGIYGTQRSDLFLGHNAAWDADELVALLRCVVTNTYGLTGQNENKVTGIFPREKAQRDQLR